MRIEKCVNGHFYDAETYPHCPYCNKSQAVTAIPPRFQKLGYITFLGSGSTSQVYKDAVFDTNEIPGHHHPEAGNIKKSRAFTVPPVIPAEL